MPNIDYCSIPAIPVEAVNINGQYIEEAIEGYRTLYTKGREALALEMNTFSVGTANGETVKSTRYPTRVITVGFELRALDAQAFRQKFNHLNNLLSMDEADFVFADETDKFFTGTPLMSIDVDPGRNWVTGEWQIYCADPFKYSVDPIEVTAIPIAGSHAAQFNINYLGTYPAKPVLRAEFAGALSGGDYSEDGDCGFVAFMDSDENIIQLGNPDAIDLDAYTKAESLINREFTTISGWQTSGGHTYGNKSIAGSITPGNITDTYWNKGAGKTLSFAKPSYGSGSNWHGPILRKNTNGAVDFELSIVHRMCVNTSGEIGTFECGAYTGATMIAGIVIEKTANGTSGTVKYIVNGKVKATQAIDLSYYNTNFGYCKRTPVYVTQYYNKKKKKWQTSKIKGAKTKKVVSSYTYTQSNLNTTIKKAKSTVTFSVGGLAKKTITDTDIELLVAEDVSFHFGAKGTNPTLNTNAINSVKFVRNPSDKFADIPNVFSSGDVVEADTGDASVYLMHKNTVEGELAPQYGALGNDWEDFMLSKGSNAIQAVWSEWVDEDYAPVLKIIYNEVYI